MRNYIQVVIADFQSYSKKHNFRLKSTFIAINLNTTSNFGYIVKVLRLRYDI